MTLAIGETTEVQGSGSKPYVVKNVDGIIWSCTCPSWKNSGGQLKTKSCKHIRRVHREAAEALRIGSVTTTMTTMTTRTAAPAASAAPREEAEKKLFGCACEKGSACDLAHNPVECACEQCVLAEAEYKVGRKLRQDEKAALFGPPVLLAESIEDHMDLDPTGWWASEKLDGCRAVWTGKEFVSRQGNVFRAPDFFKANLPDHQLDGELWISRQAFQRTMSIVKSGPSDRWREVTYVVFDHPSHPGTFEERIDFLRDLGKADYMKVLEHVQLKGRKDMEAALDEVIKLGGEGLMLRKPGSRYETGRSSTLLKVKKFSDAEATVISHTPGKGRYKGRCGALVVRMPNGREFSLGTGLSDKERQNPPPVGAKVTYTFTELTDSGTGVPKCAAFLRVRPAE